MEAMIHEHALRKVEFYIHQYCLDPNPKGILDNLLKAANRGYSLGTYYIRGNFVIAPLEDLELLSRSTSTELLWAFVAENHAKHFLCYVRLYFELRGTKADIFGIEGFSVRT